VVEYYSKQTNLQPPERAILNLLKSSLSEMKMLDIGIGGGRTTVHFAPLVKTYEAIDYSEEMIAACNKRFSGYSNNVSFIVCDARSMKIFNDNTFDFILFSFNGIDYISHNERLKVFREIQRVGKPGSLFCFSTHNFLYIHRIFDLKYQLSLHPKRIARKIFIWLLIRFYYNRGVEINKLKNSKYAIFNDGVHNYRLQTYYIKPIEQIKQLYETGLFKDVRVFSLSGSEMKSETDLKCIEDIWLYYLCVIK
jgi:ubiquinone/menaquinone biosynthesis C-methylase UbiE